MEYVDTDPPGLFHGRSQNQESTKNAVAQTWNPAESGWTEGGRGWESKTVAGLMFCAS